MEEKKKVFPWKKVAIVVVIILLIVAMSPLFWTNLMIDGLSEDIPVESWLSKHTQYADNMILVTIDEDYFDKWSDKEFTEKSFNWNNVERIEYRDDYADSKTYYVIVYLKESGYDEVKKGISRFRRLNFVLWAEAYSKGFFLDL